MRIDYFYSHISPWTFLGHQRFLDIAKKYDSTIDFVPLTLARVFSASGGLPLAKRPPQRQAYRMWELKRWPSVLGIKINIEPKHFPVNDGPSAKIALLVQRNGGNISKLSLAFMRAVWQEERNISDRDTLIGITNDYGFDGNALYNESLSEPANKLLEASSTRANETEVFGAPTYVVDGEPFWGQDRLDLLERALIV
jgi:2-hydroxychromene-2-carboxylate isomerase